MTNTRFQHKRSTVSGVTPTTSDIAAGELGLNLADRRVFTSNGSAVFELGSNLTSLAVGNSTVRQIANTTGVFVNGGITLTRNDTTLGFTATSGASVGMRQQSDDNFVFYTTNTTGGSRAVFNVFANTNAPNQNSAFRFNGPVDMGSSGFYANNSLGSSGQVLTSNGTSVYWSTVASSGGTVTNIATGNGLTGGPITTTGTVSVLSNNGITANSTGLFVTQGTGAVVNSTGVHVNAAYIATIAANSASFAANLTGGNITGNYTVTESRDIRFTAAAQTDGNDGKIGAGLFASGLNIVGTQTSAGLGRQIRLYGTLIDSTGTEYVRNTGTWAITANNSTNLNGQPASFYTNATNLATGTVPTARLATGTANSTTFLRGDQTWATPAASLPGGELFNINVSAAVGFAVNTTMSAAFTAPSTAGLEYIVHSIQVTNIGTANASVSGEFSGTTYSSISYALTVPVPRESAVELLKAPKVMQPSDILRLQADQNNTLHAYITYETVTSTAFFGVGVDVTADAAFTDLHTATGNSVITSVLLANDDGVNDVKARVVWTDGSNVIQGYLCFDMIIPADATVELLEKVKYLPSGHKIRVYANVGGRLEAIIAGRTL